jgi:hypothetical protein
VQLAPDLVPLTLSHPPLDILLLQTLQHKRDGAQRVPLHRRKDIVGAVTVEPCDCRAVDELGVATERQDRKLELALLLLGHFFE